MIKAFLLILLPFRTWSKIAFAQRSVAWILLFYLLPFLVAGVAIEGYSLAHWGEKRNELASFIKIDPTTATSYAVTQFTFILAAILVGAKGLQAISSHSFQIFLTYRQCFTLMTYGTSSLILGRYLDAFPKLSTWVCWDIGALLAISILYHGVGLVLRPEQTKGFGLWIISALMVVLSNGLLHYVALAYLHGRIFR
jgi:hypothetical protein